MHAWNEDVSPRALRGVCCKICVVALAWICAVGCTPDPVRKGQRCQKTMECPVGYACVESYCATVPFGSPDGNVDGGDDTFITEPPEDVVINDAPQDIADLVIPLDTTALDSGLDSSDAGDSENQAAAPCPGPVNITDPVLEAAIRDVLPKPQGALTPEDLAGVLSLTIPTTGQTLASLVGAECLVNMTSLVFDNHQVTDLAPLASLTFLKRLSLSNNLVASVAPLATVSTLEELNVAGNKVASIAPISGLGLRVLEISANPIADLGPISGLKATLRVLIAKFLNQSNLDALAPLSNLEELDASNNVLTDIDGLTALTGMLRLNVAFNQIASITALTNLTKLQYLRFEGNKVSDLGPLSGLTQLQELVLNSNAVSDVTALAKLTNLTYLNLNASTISDVTPLAGLTKLVGLHLGGTVGKLTNIGPLKDMVNLETLGLVGNGISDISVITNLTKLSWLDLSSNAISDLQPLVDNAGLGFGDQLYLGSNPFDCTGQAANLSALKSRGVQLSSDCP